MNAMIFQNDPSLLMNLGLDHMPQPLPLSVVSTQPPSHMLQLPQEEITTIFVVGFPEDIQEREFQNMFTFASGFEAATLKFPANFDADDGVPQYKKQIIGFAKFRTRLEALQARDHLSGRKVDAERGCILKAEIAKKNLHTKRGISNDYNALHAASQSFQPMNAMISNPLNANTNLNMINLNNNHNVNHNGNHSGSSNTNTISNASTPVVSSSSISSTLNSLSSMGTMVGSTTPIPVRRAINAKEFPEIFTKPNPYHFNPSQASQKEALSAPQLGGAIGSSSLQQGGGAFSAFEFYPASAADSELATPALNRVSYSPVTADSTLNEFSNSRQPSDLDFRPPASVLSSRSVLDSPRFERPFPDLLDGASSLPSTLNPPRSMSTSVVNTELRGFNSALFSSESLLSSHAQRFPSLSINTKLASSTANGGGSLASAPHNGVPSLHVPALGAAAAAAVAATTPTAPTASPTSFGPGYRSLADQNPPCNTLYVGNLPPNTNENELRELFSKCPGYKRLSFRTRPNGPMCFVEFEDVQYAQVALNELHGSPLSNSIKGGIRLSFSKNPLGVRQPSNTPTPQPSVMGQPQSSQQQQQQSQQQLNLMNGFDKDSSRLVFSF